MKVMVFLLALAAATEEVAVIHTQYGKIAFRFFPDAAPGHVAYLKQLIGEGFYNGSAFHRVIPHFVVQGGDPNSKDADRSNDGAGKSDRRLKAEFSSKLHYRPGTVGMARGEDPDSASCQFFIAVGNVPRLDGRYTIFGEVIEGLDAARKISGLARDLRDNPLERVEMRVTLEKRKVPAAIVSENAGPSGEVLTGPDKPRILDLKDAKWTPPVLSKGKPLKGPPVTLDVSLSETGTVLDVRFARADTAGAEKIAATVRKWKFTPAQYEGKPAKSRFSIQSDGTLVK